MNSWPHLPGTLPLELLCQPQEIRYGPFGEAITQPTTSDIVLHILLHLLLIEGNRILTVSAFNLLQYYT
jgi:hypothetical protein